MSLATPDKIRSLQRKLYCKAKAEPAYRFYLLYDKICRQDILHHSYALARANAGAPGVDGVTFNQIDASDADACLAGLREELVSKTYRPDPVRRVTIPKPGGGERPLGIPTVRDRVVQTAAKIVLEPIFEADFEDSAYGYRPRRSAVDAVKETHRLICRGYTDVVDADLSKYFDTASYYPLVHEVRSKSSGCRAIALIRSPFCFPRMTWTASSSPRLTHCHTVWRETPSAFIASRMGKKPSPASLLNRAMMSLVNRMRQGAPGVNCSPRMIPALSKRLGEGRPAGKLRFPWLYAGTTPLSQRWQLVSGRKPVQEERAADQDESQRPADAGQQERVAEGANSTEPPLGRLGCLLLPWRSRIGVSGR